MDSNRKSKCQNVINWLDLVRVARVAHANMRNLRRFYYLQNRTFPSNQRRALALPCLLCLASSSEPFIPESVSYPRPLKVMVFSPSVTHLQHLDFSFNLCHLHRILPIAQRKRSSSIARDLIPLDEFNGNFLTPFLMNSKFDFTKLSLS